MKLNNNLIGRINRFKNTFHEDDLVHPLIARIRLSDAQFNSIKNAALIYLSRILKAPSIKNELSLLDHFKLHGESLNNITPTGMILPKTKTSLEYNLLLREYYSAINDLYFSEKLSFCHTPAHLRVRWPTANSDDLIRPRHAPEELHFDSWSGYSSHGLTFLLGLMGDVKGNRVNFYEPNDSYDENWLLQEKKPHSEILNSAYKLINWKPEFQDLVILDTSVLHQTFRETNADLRFSIDNIFTLKERLNTTEFIEPAREEELTSPKLLSELGSRCLYFCDHNENQFKDSKKGTVDPTSFKFISIR